MAPGDPLSGGRCGVPFVGKLNDREQEDGSGEPDATVMSGIAWRRMDCWSHACERRPRYLRLDHRMTRLTYWTPMFKSPNFHLAWHRERCMAPTLVL